MLEAIAGYDPADSTSVNLSVPRYSAALTGDIKGLRVGVPKEYFIAGMQPEVEQAIRICQEIDYHFGLDLIVRKPAAIKRRLALGDTFLLETTQRGIVLYERSNR